MTKNVDFQGIETDTTSELPDGSIVLDPVEAAGTTVAPTPQRPLWKPDQPQYCKAIALQFGVSTRTVQRTKEKIAAACPWIEEADLRLPDERYTPLCLALMENYWQSGLKIEAWKAQIQSEEGWIAAVPAAYLEKLPNPSAPPKQAEVPLSPTEVVSDRFGTCDHGSGLTLHLGAGLSLPGIAAIVAPGNDTAYLEQIQQRLDQFEVFQQQTIAQMHEQFEQAKSLNAQYQEAMSLSDQLLLKEFQLKGVQLGYTAISLKQEAFKATVQAAEAGTLPVPGKPQGETEPLQSV